MYKGQDQHNWGLEQEASNSWFFDTENESQDSGDQELIVKCWVLSLTVNLKQTWIACF